MLALSGGGPAELVETAEQFDDALQVASRSHAAGDVDLGDDGATATVPATAELELDGLGTWTYDLTIDLASDDGTWRVAWSPRTVHPQLEQGLRAARVRSWPQRGEVLAHDGSVLAGPVEVVVVSLHGERIEDAARVREALIELTPASQDEAEAALAEAEENPTWRVPVVPMRRPDFEAVRDELFPVPGVVFPTEQRHLQVAPDLAEHVIGTVGPITEELLEQFGEPYVATDVVGRSGLELAFERRLAGRPSGEVRLVDAAGDVAHVLETFDGEDPQPLRTTLDIEIQQAAERAVREVEEPVAVVALDAGSGAVRAAVSRPVEGPGRAFTGRYPPGSTFKVVTTDALLAAGVTPSTTVPCPAEVTVDGKVFGNAHDLAPGDISFGEAFAVSCNTAFVDLALDLPEGALATSAERFGFGADYPGFPLPVAGGQFPVPASRVDRAAAAIGQAQVLVTPLHNATVAAAVRSGVWRAPHLTDEPVGEATAAPTTPPAPVGELGTLAELMRRVVASGTGTAADVGGDVHGKTGTAEYGTGEPPPTHAWFIGFRDDLAFAVLVEGGGGGGEVAAPVAAALMRELGP